jgi:hypothetical protein
MSSVQLSDFEDNCLLVQHDRLYAIPVRRASVLPAASFGFGLTTNTLAVRLTVPTAGSVEDFHLQAGVPCRAHNKKGPQYTRAFMFGKKKKGINPPPEDYPFFQEYRTNCSLLSIFYGEERRPVKGFSNYF